MIKLKSKNLIEYFGKDEITDQELKDLDSIYLSDNNFNSQNDIKIFKEDLIKIVKEDKNLLNIELNVDKEIIPIDELLKNSPTESIMFTGSNEMFNKMKENKLEISEKLKRELVLDDNSSEYDLFEALCTCKSFETYPRIDAKDLETVLKYINIDQIKVHASSKEDYELIKKYSNGKNINLDIDVSLLKETDVLWKDISNEIYLNVNKVKDFSKDELDVLEQSYDIKDIYMGNEYDIEKYNNAEDIDYCSTSEHYDPQTYKRIEQELKKLVEGIDKETSDFDKFCEIYKRIGNKVSYDHERVEITADEDGTTFIGGLPEIHNLKAGLLEGLSVCEGYSKILHQALDMVGIDSKFIVGKSSEEEHAWNQVKIDGKWYNTDLTWDAENIKNGRPLEYCLQSDEDFLFHTPNANREIENCIDTIDPEIINDKLISKEEFEIEDKVYSVEEIMEAIKQVNDLNDIGTRTAIREDLDNGGYILDLCNLKEDGYEWRDKGIKIGDLENVSNFITQYTKMYAVNDIEHSGVVDFISSQEGIDLVLDDYLKEQVKEQGIDCDELLRISKEKGIQQEEITEEQIENSELETQVIEEPVLNEDITEEKSLEVYKPSLWKSIITAVKNRIEKIKERFSYRNKNSEKEDFLQEEDMQIVNEQEIDQNKDQNENLPSWDLRNWSEEQLIEAQEQAKLEKERKEIIRKQQQQEETLEK